MEEAIVESAIECLQSLEMEKEIRDDVLNELNSIIEYCDQHPELEIEAQEWSEDAQILVDQIQVFLQTEQTDLATAINELNHIESSAKRVLTEEESTKILMATAIMRHSLDYWYNNYTTWFPIQTRSGSNWRRIAGADLTWGCVAGGLTGTPIGGNVLRWASKAARLLSWQAQAIIMVSAAAIGSAEEAIFGEDVEASEELRSDLCCTLAEKAIRTFICEEAAEEEVEESEESEN